MDQGRSPGAPHAEGQQDLRVLVVAAAAAAVVVVAAAAAVEVVDPDNILGSKNKILYFGIQKIKSYILGSKNKILTFQTASPTP